MPTRLSNLNLFVADVARSARFYSTVFGLEWDQTRSQPPGFAILNAGDLTLTLQSPETPGAVVGQAQSVELGFETEDLQALRSALEAEGVEITPTQFMGWGSGFDAKDPDGIRLTVFRKNEEG